MDATIFSTLRGQRARELPRRSCAALLSGSGNRDSECSSSRNLAGRSDLLRPMTSLVIGLLMAMILGAAALQLFFFAR